MAAGYLNHLAGGRVSVLSAGSQPAEQVNPVAVEAMAEHGIDLASETPKLLSGTTVMESDVVITMGCGDTCPIYPGTRYEDWEVDDPAGPGPRRRPTDPGRHRGSRAGPPCRPPPHLTASPDSSAVYGLS